MGVPGGHRFLLTCAMTRYDHCAEWDREELRTDVARMVGLFCGDFLPEAGRYTHADVLGESPTSVELRDRLRDFFLSPDRHPDDYVAVYLTGHGEILEDGDFVVLTRDTRPSDLLNRTVLAGDIVKMALAGTRVRRLLLLLDTCYAGQGGEDMTREALRRIDDPAKSSEDLGQAAEGGGVVLVAATQPYQRALPGAFTSCLDRAARSLAAGNNAPPTLRVGALIGAMNSDRERPRSQTSAWHQVGMTGDEPSFIMNPRYRPPLADADLLDQERARHAEQRADELRDRFLPAIRWFTGRHAALTGLGRWLGNPAPPGAAVVTGRAGSGKTALLGLLAALADPDQAPGVPRSGLPAGLAVPDGAIGELIYAGTMTTSQVRDRIAVAAGLRAETTAELIDGLSGRGGGALTVLIDALDEAADPPGLASGLLGPLIRERPGGLRLLLGTRPHLLTAKLLGKPGTGRYQLIDLDSAAYADPASIRGYIRRILLSDDSLDSAYRPSGIYRDAAAAVLDAVTDAIGEAAGASFLVARITAATEATAASLPAPADPAWRQALPRHAGQAMRRDLDLRLGQDADKAAALLLPLAYAQGSGLPWEDIWPRLADALSPGHGYGNQDLIWLRTAAGSYAVEGLADGRSAYRLYHRALAEYLLERRDQRADQQAITAALACLVPPREGGARDWPAAHPYIRAHLATHAAQAGRIDDLLTDPAFLLAAGRPQLFAAAGAARSVPARSAADAYRRATHHLRTAPAGQHASYLQLAARCGRALQLADALDSYRPPGTWSSRWASWRLATSHRALTGHTSWVDAVAAAELDGRPVVISASHDRTVRVWDLATGTPVGAPFTGHTSAVGAVAAAELDGRPAVAAAELDGRPVAVSASTDQTVRVWDLARCQAMRRHLRRIQLRHAEPVLAAILIQRRDCINLITGCTDSLSQAWDLAAWRVLSRTIVPGQASVAAISALAPDHVLYANGRTMSLYKGSGAAAPLLTIELGSEILALGTHGTSTVVAATRLGLVALEVPH